MIYSTEARIKKSKEKGNRHLFQDLSHEKRAKKSLRRSM